MRIAEAIQKSVSLPQSGSKPNKAPFDRDFAGPDGSKRKSGSSGRCPVIPPMSARHFSEVAKRDPNGHRCADPTLEGTARSDVTPCEFWLCEFLERCATVV